MEHTVLVTGATAGFGEATARRFLAHGHQVIALGRRAERLDALKASLPVEQQKKLLTLAVDVCDSAKVDGLAACEGKHADSHKKCGGAFHLQFLVRGGLEVLHPLIRH